MITGDASALGTPLVLALAFLGGGVVGWVHFVSLRRVVDAWANGAATRAVVFTVLRWAVLVTGAVVAVRFGAMALLLAALGLVLARAVVLRRSGGLS